MYQIRILLAAVRDLEKLDRAISQRIINRVSRFSSNFEEMKLEALRGDLAGLYKLRIGDFRVIYEILQEEKTIIVHQIGHRSEIYRKR